MLRRYVEHMHSNEPVHSWPLTWTRSAQLRRSFWVACADLIRYMPLLITAARRRPC